MRDGSMWFFICDFFEELLKDMGEGDWGKFPFGVLCTLSEVSNDE